MEVSSHEDSASEFCCVGSIFSIKLLGFASKTIELLLTELVRQYGKGCGQYISALTSHSVNKSIVSLNSNFACGNRSTHIILLLVGPQQSLLMIIK